MRWIRRVLDRLCSMVEDDLVGDTYDCRCQPSDAFAAIDGSRRLKCPQCIKKG